MKKNILWMLLGINLALVGMLLFGALGNTAHAQRVVRPNDYLLIPGELPGTSQGVVYIIDASTGALSAMTYEDSNRRLQKLPPIDLNRVFGGQAPGR
jgi:hypothetical protein